MHDMGSSGDGGGEFNDGDSESTVYGAVKIPEELGSIRVVGLGMAGMDLVACVSQYPEPDTKVRTTSLTATGGGNCANTLTGLRRLGISTRIISQTGDDAYGRAVRDELQADGVDVSYISVRKGVPTALSYVIVDTSAATRTCIATVPEEELDPDQLPLDALDDADLLVLDGRHTRAAARMAREANMRGVPVLLDVERDRPHLRDVLPHADYIITNRSFPRSFASSISFSSSSLSKDDNDVDALRVLLEACDARFVIRTAGAAGCSLLRRAVSPSRATTSRDDVRSEMTQLGPEGIRFELLIADARRVERVVDTTGAGDAFIAGVAYGLSTRMPFEQMLSLGSFVAATKLGAVGPRSGLPRRDAVPANLLAIQSVAK